MIADDEPKIRQGLKSVLEEMKLPITVCAEARNGMEALEKIEQFQPDFILMDICMPKLSGIQFLEELRKLDKNCPVIVISGFNEFSYAKQAIKLGVSEYLLKPIAEEELQIFRSSVQIFSCRQKKKWVESVLLRQENVLLKHCLILAVRCAGKCRKCRNADQLSRTQENIFMPIIRTEIWISDRWHMQLAVILLILAGL